jgi:hypothetical protein
MVSQQDYIHSTACLSGWFILRRHQYDAFWQDDKVHESSTVWFYLCYWPQTRQVYYYFILILTKSSVDIGWNGCRKQHSLKIVTSINKEHFDANKTDSKNLEWLSFISLGWQCAGLMYVLVVLLSWPIIEALYTYNKLVFSTFTSQVLVHYLNFELDDLCT